LVINFNIGRKLMTGMTQRLLTLSASMFWFSGMIFAASAQEPPLESKGQNAIELCSLDLTAEIESVAGRRLRLRLITLEPGGVVAVHSHQDRPMIMQVLQGSMLSHLGDKPDRILRVGDCAAEGKDITRHWMENPGTEPIKFIAIDVTK
jgi:quercetin dioxygenase-like cupin family protein